MSSRAKRGIYCLSLATLLCAVAAPARAAGGAEARFHWQLGFGADSLETSYGLSLGYAGGEHFAPLSRVVELNVTPRAALATVAGLPLFTRSYRAHQSQTDRAYDAGVDSRPWYTRSWVYWTLGGVAATAALLGTAASSGNNSEGGASIRGGVGCSTSDQGGNVGPVETPPPPQGCLVPTNADGP